VAPEGCEAQYVVRKAAPDVRAIDEDKRRVTVVASDATLDRYGDTIAADGWKTANFEKNPVVLLDHWYVVEYIVGQCAKWWVEGGQFLNEHAFDPAGTNAKADMAWQKILNRSLRAVSVGFRALKWAKRGWRFPPTLQQSSRRASASRPRLPPRDTWTRRCSRFGRKRRPRRS
jgi:hypothetical protein